MFMGKTKFFTPDLTVQKTFKERLSEKMGNRKYLNKTLTIKLFDKLIEEIKIMGE